MPKKKPNTEKYTKLILKIFLVHFNGLSLLAGGLQPPADVFTDKKCNYFYEYFLKMVRYGNTIYLVAIAFLSQAVTHPTNKIEFPRHNYINSTDYPKLKLQL